MHFAVYAQAHGAKLLTDLACHVQGFVEHWISDRQARSPDKPVRPALAKEIRNPIDQMLRLALPGYVGRRRSRKAHPFVDQAPGFFGYLREERGLRLRSVHIYEYCLHNLQTYLQSINVTHLSELSPAILSAFVTSRGQQWSKCAVTQLCSALRVFLRYLHRERLTGRDLSSSIDAPKRYCLAELPRSISWKEVQRMLEVVDRRTPLGKRDYAILLLLVTYGLRSREIAALALDDLDWERERLRVPERKAGHSTAYPLSPLVGDAILNYLKHGRPKTTERHLFCRVIAPYGPYDASAVSHRATYYLRKAGVKVARAGSHTLRHTCVQRLVDAHFSLKTIGDYVGHGSPDSTMIYSKINVEALREVAQGNGEEVL